MEAIRYSRLPPTVIKKLQLCSTLRRPLLGPLTKGRENPRGFVPSTEIYDHPTRPKLESHKKTEPKAEASRTGNESEGKEKTPSTEEIQTTKKTSKSRRKKHLEEDASDKEEEEEEDVSSGEEEEWDRHRTLHNDVSAR